MKIQRKILFHETNLLAHKKKSGNLYFGVDYFEGYDAGGFVAD